MTDIEPEVTIWTLNAANGRRDDYTDYKFSNRLDRIIEWMKSRKKRNTIFCLQELRTCVGKDSKEPLQLKEILSRISNALGMIYDLAVNCIRPESMAKATFYDPNEFMRTHTEVIWPSNNGVPSGVTWAQSCLVSRFICIEGSQARKGQLKSSHIFQIYNCHAPCDTRERRIYLDCLLDKKMQDDTIIVGDFNTFNTEEGQADFNMLAEKWVHVSGNQAPTFYSFPHDLDAHGRRYCGVLDHIFVMGNQFIDRNFKVVINRWDAKAPLSDHCALMFQFKLVRSTQFMQ